MSPNTEDSPFWPVLNPLPIPTVFRPFLEPGYFENCIVCRRRLRSVGVSYLIEKAFRGTEVICEYAICLACAQNMQTDLSAESMERLEAYCDERVDLEARHERLIELSPDNVEPWISHCVLTGTPMAESEGYHLYALCDDTDLLLCHLPYMICNEALRDMAGLLSSKTKETLDDFTGDYLGMPPEYRELLDDAPVLCL